MDQFKWTKKKKKTPIQNSLLDERTDAALFTNKTIHLGM